MTEPLPGLYEHVVTDDWAERLERVTDPVRVKRELLDPDLAPDVLARHIGALTRQALRGQGVAVKGGISRLTAQIKTVNQIVSLLGELAPNEVTSGDLIATSQDLLHAVSRQLDSEGAGVFPIRPTLPLASSGLLANRGGESIGHALSRELASADRVDLICAFVKWSGLRIIREQLDELMSRGAELRVITTTYMGATEQRAIDALVEMGAQVKISYETKATRLHAKAWYFHRNSGTSTAYVGSSNMSRPALTDGIEWNVRFSALEQPHLMDTFEDNFDYYWAEDDFEKYDGKDPAQRERLRRALEREGSGSLRPKAAPSEPGPQREPDIDVEILPYSYQRQVLDELAVERELYDRHSNLVVMATGTGKTVVAALDYRRLRNAGQVSSLLFVAHRHEILKRSLKTFREVLQDAEFGELYVRGEKPKKWQHVFASVQSLARLGLDELHPEQFDMVIVDEFHHAAADTYTRLLSHLQAKELVGLTATPERADDKNITRWFAGHTAVELRLWEAIDRGLLVPFQYFGIDDRTELARIRFSRSTGYDIGELESLYTGNDARVNLIINAVEKITLRPLGMRALGFCVSIAHAEFMARKFNEAGIPALAVTSSSDPATRDDAPGKLVEREVNVLFTVDLYNEGIDIPCIDTVLFLRPTESATVFLQQLGRGLRRDDEKACLTVLDFIGAQHADFRFEPKMRALVGGSRRDAIDALQGDFPLLPSGCAIKLDQLSHQRILKNLQSKLGLNVTGIVAELEQLGDIGLAEFLERTGLELEQLYRPGDGTWSGLRKLAGLSLLPAGPSDGVLDGSLRRMLHIDDPERMAYFDALVAGDLPQRIEQTGTRAKRLAAMAHTLLWRADRTDTPMESALRKLVAEQRRVAELQELLPVLRKRMHRVTRPLTPQSTGDVPLHVHARYSRYEAVAGFGKEYGGQPTGVEWIPEEKADLFFVDLIKSDKHFSVTTRYEDRVVTPTLFQWETQNKEHSGSVAGRRYINHVAEGSTLHLFVRESKKQDSKLGVPAYLYVGPATYESHVNDSPMRLALRLENPLPLDVFGAWRKLSGQSRPGL